MPHPVEFLLWKATEAPVYFLGTIHFGPPDGYLFGPKNTRAIDGSEKFVLEADPRNLQFDRTILNRSSGSLREDLGDDRYERFCRSEHYDPAFENVKLGCIFATLGSKPYTEMGWVHTGGADTVLANMAVGGKKLETLETPVFQIERVMGISPEEAVVVLDLELNQPGYFRSIAARVVESSMNRDERQLSDLRALTMSSTPNFSKTLFADRENAWLPRIVSAIDAKESVLFAMGVLHFVGDGNCLDLLRARGHSVGRL